MPFKISKATYSGQSEWQVGVRLGQSGLHGFSYNFQCLLNAVCDSSDSTGVTHCFQKFSLILPRMLPREFDFEVDGPSIRNTMPCNIGFAVVSDIHDGAVFRVELPYRMIPSDTAVSTQSSDYFVL